jgi:hypothetical protein
VLRTDETVDEILHVQPAADIPALQYNGLVRSCDDLLVLYFDDFHDVSCFDYYSLEPVSLIPWMKVF